MTSLTKGGRNSFSSAGRNIIKHTRNRNSVDHVEQLFNPVRGYRDELRRQGIEPKNHHRDNIQKIKETQYRNKQRKQAAESQRNRGSFKLKQFQNVESRALKTNSAPGGKTHTFLRRKSGTTSRSSRPTSRTSAATSSASSTRASPATGIRRPVQGGHRARGSPQKAAVPTRAESAYKEKRIKELGNPDTWDNTMVSEWISLLPTPMCHCTSQAEMAGLTGPQLISMSEAEVRKNFSAANQRTSQLLYKYIKQLSKRSAAPRNYVRGNFSSAFQANPAKRAKETESYTKKKCYGKVPDYLVQRKMDEIEEQQRKEEEKEKAKIPPGTRLMSDSERLDTIRILNENKERIQDAINHLPLKVESRKMKIRQQDLLERMEECEGAIKTFSKKTVYIKI